jgi:hypothetical protein
MSPDVRKQALRFFRLALLIAAFGIGVPPAHAALLRGQLNRVGPGNTRVPAPAITVTVYSPKNGRSPAVTTNPFGFYYINVPPGPYTLEIWVTKPPRAYPIVVRPTTTDIPPITI